MSDGVSSRERLPYEKPRLRTIDLVAEEVLATACKINPAQTALNISNCVAGVCHTNSGS